MKRDNINYLAAGMTVVVAFTLLFWVLYKITGRSGPTDEYFTFYDQVAGLRYGTPVYYEGYRIGQVETISPEHSGTQTTFRVDFSVEQGWPIPIDSVAQVATAGLLSDVFIVLEQGESDQTMAAGAQIKGREAADIFASLNSLAGDVSELKDEKIVPLLDTVSERIDAFTKGVEDGSAGEIVDRVRGIMAKVDDSAAGLKALLGIENRDRVTTTLDNLQQMSGSAAEIANQLRDTRAEFDRLVAQLNATVSETRPGVDQTLGDLQLAVETMAVRLDSITFQLDEASRNMNEFSRTIRSNPNRLLFSPSVEEPE